MTNKTYLFSKESYSHFQEKYTSLMQRITSLYKEINLNIQMDHQSDELSKLYIHYKELKLLAKQLEWISQSIEVIDDLTTVQTHPLKIDIGATVIIQLENGEILNYTIGHYGETNMKKQLISYTHPLAQKLIGKHEGDEFEYNNRLISILYVGLVKAH